MGNNRTCTRRNSAMTSSTKTESTSTNTTTNSGCDSCGNEVTEKNTYRCKSCSASGEGIADKVYCDMCIVSFHLRRNHDIVDSNGYEPAMCRNHRDLSQKYCEKCRVLFCFKCMDKHSDHKG